MRPGLLIVGLWGVWAGSWTVAAIWSSRAQKRVALRSELGYRVPMFAGTAMMVVPAHRYEGVLRLWHIGWVGAWACAALILAGLAFTWWARIHLGRLWSGAVTRKADHRVVDTGPYRIVRHPIYTGLLLALAATAAAKGTLLGVAGLVLLGLGMWAKARLEEEWLIKELGDAYGAYRARVPMLIPFV